MIQWTGNKPLKEYDFEHSTRRETVICRKVDKNDLEVKLTSYSLEKNSGDFSSEIEPISAYTSYTEANR